MISRDELSELLKEVFFFTDKATPLNKIKREMKEMGPTYERDPGKFLENVYKVVALPLPRPIAPAAPAAAPSAPKSRMLLDPFWDQAWQACQEGAFDNEPPHIKAMYEAYCSPLSSDKRGKYYDEMTERQKKTIGGMNECMIAHKYKKAGASNIEDAMDNAIKAEIKKDQNSS